MEKLLRDKRIILLFVGPALLVYIVVLLVPMLSSLYLTAFRWNALSAPRFVGLTNFIYMFTQDQVFPEALLNGFKILLVSLVVEQLFGFFIAAALMSKVRFKNAFRNIYFMPAVLSSVAVGTMWVFLYNPKIGLIDSFFRVMGLGFMAQNWLTNAHWAVWSIAFVAVWQYAGYSMTLFFSGMQGIPDSLYDAALIDGAGYWQVVGHITLPLIRPIIKVNTILITIGSLKFFDLVYVMTGGGPDHATDVLASYMYNQSFLNFALGYGDALSVILLVISLVLTLVINRFFRVEPVEF